MDAHDKRFEKIEKQLTSLENIVTRIEVEHGEKIQILFEQLSIISEKLDLTLEKLEKMNKIIDDHALRIEVLEEKVLNSKIS